jgi:pilus assembly protein CpaB
MNTQRVLILGVAFVAAVSAALLVRALTGGGTEKAKASLPPPRPTTSEVLVAASNLQPGTALTADSVRWEQWPKSAVDSSFITHDTVADFNSVIRGAVVRAPLVSGEPLTASNIVHADSAGFLAAMVNPGMRAISIGISTETGAGGFILPNDRVDVLVTTQISDSPRRFATRTLLHDIRVLAVDQTYREDKDQKVVLAKTATLELPPHEAEKMEQAQAGGTVSLTLRALGDYGSHEAAGTDTNNDSDATALSIIGYGVGHPAGSQGD